MPVLQKILVSDFRNVSFAALEFCDGVNCICGSNGQGKTNLLDAVHYLCMTKSFLGIPDAMCRRWEAPQLSVAGTFLMRDGDVCRFSIVCSEGAKTVRRDDKVCKRLSEHIGVLPVVAVSPSDISMVSESGEERRRFFNALLSQTDPQYMAALQKYNRLLDQRNRILKEQSPDDTLLCVLDSQMSQCAAYVSERRSRAVLDMADDIRLHCRALSGGEEEISVSYRSDFADAPGGLEEVLRRNRRKDLYLNYTTAGVQRDDFIFEMNGHPLRRCGSQGQQKSFLVALKLAQYSLMTRACGYPPILLLDDVFDKLDATRTASLLDLVRGGGFGQIFISDTSRERLGRAVGAARGNVMYFNAVNGEFNPVGEEGADG